MRVTVTFAGESWQSNDGKSPNDQRKVYEHIKDNLGLPLPASLPGLNYTLVGTGEIRLSVPEGHAVTPVAILAVERLANQALALIA